MRSIRWSTGMIRGSMVILVSIGSATAETFPGLHVPDGFEVREFATDEQAHDIYCMTIDALGRVVVSGPGYVKILEDRDRDGKAETVIPFANGPASGQGMCFHGRPLLAIGDGGLLRYRDQNRDSRADGPPELFLRFKTGGEHDVHAIQQGPDGWWYVIAGNNAGINASYAALPTSPVKSPRAGVLMRFRPDLTSGEIIADGFRNTYDFAFNRQGDIFTYDSDDERDVSLPWYRPTRVFHSMIGADHGWISKSWKRPDYFCDMPPVVAPLGRGSPTGVACYEHTQFPEKYRNALFVLDWTYGRVMALPLALPRATWTAEPEDFLTAAGGNGFAPTDVEVGPDGCLYVSVGGRGTRGSVYQVRWISAELECPSGRSDDSRRAVGGLSPGETAVEQLVSKSVDAAGERAESGRRFWPRFWTTSSQSGRADAGRRNCDRAVRRSGYGDGSGGGRFRVAGSDGRGPPGRLGRSLSQNSAQLQVADLLPFLADADPLVAAPCRGSLPGVAAAIRLRPVDPGDREATGESASLRPGSGVGRGRQGQCLSAGLRLSGRHSGRGGRGRGVCPRLADADRQRPAQAQKVVIPLSTRVLTGDYPSELKRDAVRLLERSLGDLGPAPNHPAAFDGYASPVNLQAWERELDPLRTELASIYPADDPVLNEELARLIAMLQPYNPKLLDAVLAGITEESPAVADIHLLLVAARISVQRNATEREKIAHALVDLERKFAERKLPQDSDWNDRIKELYTRLAELDPYLAAAIIAEPGFGRPGHVLFMSQLSGDFLPQAIESFVRTIEATPDYPWNNDVIFVLAASSNPAHLQLVRDQFETFSVRGAVLMALAEKASPRRSAEVPRRAGIVAGGSPLGLFRGAGEIAAGRGAGGAIRAAESCCGDWDRTNGNSPRGNRSSGCWNATPAMRRRSSSANRRHRPQPEAVAQWTQWISERWPEEAAGQLGGSGAEVAQLQKILAETPWEQGDVQRGEKLFTTRSCAQCHGGRNALGPDLAGSAGRFSRNDLFTAIVLPSRDVSSRYQTTILETYQGKVYSGLVVYESVDGLLLRNATNQTFRIEARDVASRTRSPVSLMPNGLLKDLGPRDYADLYAYLRTLGAPKAAAEQTQR